MGRISCRRGELVEQLVEVLLFKTGLSLAESELRGHAESELLAGEPEDAVSFRAEEYEALVYDLLYKIGYAETPEPPLRSFSLAQKYKNDPHKMMMLDEIMTSWGRCAMERTEGEPIDLTPMLADAGERFGADGFELASEFRELLVAHVNGSPWSRMRRVEWRDEATLRDLFESANLVTPHGKFFDQRYIDYLSSQFDGAIDRIHWRKFEALTCEFFHRQGCRVEIGPGTNDDNVDARVWWPGDEPGAPATLLVQCKRQRETIGKVVMKALYADVDWEKASGGLIVTTQRLARGTENVRVARSYPIGQADRDALRRWIGAMRSK